MTIDHVAIWAKNLESVKDYYVKYFGGVPSQKYVNEERQFQSYFILFGSGAKLEIMNVPYIVENCNINNNYKGFTHMAFGVETMSVVNEMAIKLKTDGYKITNGPRATGDGYYEFETLDPENNRIEITTKFSPK